MTFRFDQFELDPVRGTLRGTGGALIELRPKAHALLAYLAQHPERLHTRQDLMDALWPGLAVTDDSLTQCVSDLRRALGDRAPHVLRTVPRRGYLLNAAVELLEPPLPPSRRPAPAASLPDHQGRETRWNARTASVAVLPMEHPADDLASSYLARTLTSDLISELSAFEDLRVHPSGTSALPGTYHIAGEVRPAPGVLRIAVRLYTTSGVALFGIRLEVPAEDFPELVPAELLKLARALVLQINTEDRRRARLMPDMERTARQHCLLAQEHHQRATEQDTHIARVHLETAIAQDPDYAPSYAWLCFVAQRSFTQGWGDMDNETARTVALQAARRGVQLEPASPLCLARLAYALMLHGRHEEAVATARAALRSHRRLTWESTTTAAETLGCCGQHREAIDVLRAALIDDAQCAPTTHAILGRSLLLAGEPDAALVELQFCRTRVPAYLPCLQSIVVAAAETGQMDVAANARADLAHYHSWWSTQTERGHWVVRSPDEDARFRNAFDATEAFAAAMADWSHRSTTKGLA